MEPGKVQTGDHVFYVAVFERHARLFEVEIAEVLYPGTTHETIKGQTYDVETSGFISHTVSHKDYWVKRDTALDRARIQLIDELQQLRAKAMSLGFFLK